MHPLRFRLKIGDEMVYYKSRLMFKDLQNEEIRQ